MRGGWAGILVVGVVACGDDGGARSETAAEARIAIHEWGVIAVPRAGETSTAMAMSGSRQVAPWSDATSVSALFSNDEQFGVESLTARGLKPVIYVHLDGAREASLSVRVGAPNGEMLEVLPESAPGSPRTEARWLGLRASGRSCASTVPPGGPPCRANDRYCEALEDFFYDTDDSTCLHLRNGDTRNHLFYRARVDGGRLPMGVRRDGDALLVRNHGRYPIPGPAFRIAQAGNGAVLIGRFDPPAAGVETRVALPASGDVPATRAALIATIRERGLTAAEARAFDRAWAHLLFDVPVPRELEGLQVGDAPEALRASRDVILHLLPDETAAEVLRLGIEPRPAAVHRALFVRLDTMPPTAAPEAAPSQPVREYTASIARVELGDAGRFEVWFGEGTQPGLSRERVRRILSRHLGDVAYCAGVAPDAWGDDGELELQLRIERDGTARPVPTDDTRVGCWGFNVPRWTFPAADRPTAVRVTFRLRPR